MERPEADFRFLSTARTGKLAHGAHTGDVVSTITPAGECLPGQPNVLSSMVSQAPDAVVTAHPFVDGERRHAFCGRTTTTTVSFDTQLIRTTARLLRICFREIP